MPSYISGKSLANQAARSGSFGVNIGSMRPTFGTAPQSGPQLYNYGVQLKGFADPVSQNQSGVLGGFRAPMLGNYVGNPTSIINNAYESQNLYSNYFPDLSKNYVAQDQQAAQNNFDQMQSTYAQNSGQKQITAPTTSNPQGLLKQYANTLSDYLVKQKVFY